MPGHAMQPLSPLRAWTDDLAAALRLLTRLPVPRHLPADPDWSRAGRAYPLVGLLIGSIGALTFALAGFLGLPAVLCALLALAATIAVSGALHEDGLADVADGFGGGGDRDRKLAIMRDSRIGTYGVLALLLSVGLRAAALAALGAPALGAPALVAAALPAVHALARALLPAVMLGLPLARRDGLAAATGKPRARDVFTALGLGIGAVWLLWGPGTALLLFAVAAALAAGLSWLARRQVGGYTGDLLGAVEQAVETVLLLILVALVA